MGRTIWINSLGLWGIRPITSLPPPPVRPHYGERTTSNGAKLPDSACSEENDYLSLGLHCFAIEYESYSLFFFSCFPARLYQKVHVQLGKRLQKDQSPDKLLLVTLYESTKNYITIIVVISFR